MSCHPLPGEDAVVDGVRLHHVRHGRDDAKHPYPTIVLLHGLEGPASNLWYDVMRDLGHDHRTVAVDLAGLGRSERPARRLLALEAQARLVWRLLDKLRAGRVVLVGHGLGGAVAAHLAAQAPDRVAGIVLVAGVVHADAWPAGSPWRLLLDPARRPFVRAIDMAAAEAAWRQVCVAPPPALVLWPERAPLSAAYGRRVADEIRAAWVPVEGGPWLPVERPERVAEEIDGFVAELHAAEHPTPAR